MEENVAGAALVELGLDVVRLMDLGSAHLERFADAPIIVGNRLLRDEINMYHSNDRMNRKPIHPNLKRAAWFGTVAKQEDGQSDDVLGRLPLFVGMRVMVTTNLAIGCGIVNGREGNVKEIKYRQENGYRTALCVYVEIAGVGQVHDSLPNDVVPIFPTTHSFYWKEAPQGASQRVSRIQIPLVPSYSYTDYKSQGRTLEVAIVDLYSASSTYVMLSRVKTLKGPAILRPFPARKIATKIAPQLASELARINALDILTRATLITCSLVMYLDLIEEAVRACVTEEYMSVAAGRTIADRHISLYKR